MSILLGSLKNKEFLFYFIIFLTSENAHCFLASKETEISNVVKFVKKYMSLGFKRILKTVVTPQLVNL